MFFEKILRLPHTLAFRLTLWYAGIFTLSSFVAFFLFYLSIASITQKRTDQELSIEIAEFSSLFASNGMDAVIANLHIEAESNGVEEMFLRVVTAGGKETASSNMEPWKEFGINGAALKRLAAGADPVFETVAVPDHHYGVRVVYAAIGPGTIMQIGQSLKDDEEFMEIVREIFGVTLAALMSVAGLIGWFMARRALRGVEAVTRTAREISQGALHQRVPLQSQGDEINELAATFNAMVDRIQTLIAGMREVTDNIAHDLRSPVTRIRGIAEMALTPRATAGEFAAMTANTIEECDRLLEMINTMLDIAETEAGVAELRSEDVDLAALVRDACELFAPLAEDKGIVVVAETEPDVAVAGDRQRLQRMVANLLDNAIKYTPSGGTVTVSVHGNAETAMLAVSDTGIGIADQDLPRVFERFYRGDRSRTQTGTGLGLSLARAIASAHGGAITVASTPGAGSTFTVTLPLFSGPR